MLPTQVSHLVMTKTPYPRHVHRNPPWWKNQKSRDSPAVDLRQRVPSGAFVPGQRALLCLSNIWYMVGQVGTWEELCSCHHHWPLVAKSPFCKDISSKGTLYFSRCVCGRRACSLAKGAASPAPVHLALCSQLSLWRPSCTRASPSRQFHIQCHIPPTR
jgi:hypothetical protein